MPAARTGGGKARGIMWPGFYGGTHHVSALKRCDGASPGKKRRIIDAPTGTRRGRCQNPRVTSKACFQHCFCRKVACFQHDPCQKVARFQHCFCRKVARFQRDPCQKVARFQRDDGCIRNVLWQGQHFIFCCGSAVVHSGSRPPGTWSLGSWPRLVVLQIFWPGLPTGELQNRVLRIDRDLGSWPLFQTPARPKVANRFISPPKSGPQGRSMIDRKAARSSDVAAGWRCGHPARWLKRNPVNRRSDGPAQLITDNWVDQQTG